MSTPGFSWNLSSGGTLNCAQIEDDDQLLVYDMSPSGDSSGTVAYCDTLAEARLAALEWMMQRGLRRAREGAA